MQTSSRTLRWWDWPSIIILLILLETVASRLVTTEWTPFLYIGQMVTFFGFVVGTALGRTRFSPRLARWISFLYMIVLLPLQWTLVMEQDIVLEEQLLSVGGRLLFSAIAFFSRSPVEDPFFFIAVVTMGLWILSASAAFRLIRDQNYLMVVLPSAISLLFIQNYDNLIAGRLWFIAFFAFLALLMLGRLHHLDNRRSWHKRRIFVSPDTSIDITGTMTILAGLLILVSWVPPASLSSVDAARQAWNNVTKPWRNFTDRMENAVSALDSVSGGRRGEFFGSEIGLGRGFPLSEQLMFRVQTPDLPSSLTPPRYYWRGRTYDFYWDKQWYTTGTTLVDYTPAEEVTPITSAQTTDPALFLFQTGDLTHSLVYTPSQAVWFSRTGSTRNISAGDSEEVISWYAAPSLLAGEAYQVNAVLSNPDVQELREAGSDYPDWVSDKYLQMPEEFSPKVSELAVLITESYDNPYDMAAAITRYLRANIEYTDALPEPPRNKDPLEWMLFEYKQAYCVYYATAEILMLRSLGIPARLAVGFAQGQEVGDEYLVRKLDAHAWPEVYFPGIGWVEFEPTGSQPSLTRPVPPQTREITDEFNPDLIDFLELENNPEEVSNLDQNLQLNDLEQTAETIPASPAIYLIPSIIAFIALTFYLIWRYSIPTRLPSMLRTTLERNGSTPPNWLVNWENWVNISPIERSFESINYGLRLMKNPLPAHATPIERANELTKLLPVVENDVNTVLDEHQTYLYTSRSADALRARRAAFKIRTQAIFTRIRNRLRGKARITND
ncbi:MAG: transglutaminase domain-containing protein [Anaerolineales bacterium]|nr:transglutaminase domain-containing protein [Anaerolineales bacterium]